MNLHIYHSESVKKHLSKSSSGLKLKGFICLFLILNWVQENVFETQSRIGLQSILYHTKLNIFSPTVNILKFRTPKLLIKWHMQTVPSDRPAPAPEGAV